MRKRLRQFRFFLRRRCSPRLFERGALAGLFVLALFSFAVTNLQTIFWLSSDWLVSSVLPATIVDLTNGERQEEALGGLTRNPVLDEAARLKAAHMAEHGYFAHYSPDGVSPWYWFSAVSYDFVHAGENLAVHFNDSGEVVKAWMQSTTHRDNILNSNYTEIGVGTASGLYEGSKTVYVVQLFGAPVTAAAATRPPQTTPSEATDTNPAPARPTEVLSAVTEPASASRAVLEQTSVALESEVKEPVVASAVSATQLSEAKSVWSLVTKPRLVLHILYGLIALTVLVLLLASLIMEARRHHARRVAYCLSLLIVMAGLLSFHAYLTAGAVIV